MVVRQPPATLHSTAAHDGEGVKPAVGYHGALPAPSAARPPGVRRWGLRWGAQGGKWLWKGG